MRIALAVLVAFYALLALGDYHEADVVSPMQVIMGLSIIPMCILAVGLLFSGLMGLSSKDGRTQNIVIAVLAAALLVVVGYREFRRSNRPRSEAIPYNPQAGEQNGCRQRLEGYLSCQQRLAPAFSTSFTSSDAATIHSLTKRKQGTGANLPMMHTTLIIFGVLLCTADALCQTPTPRQVAAFSKEIESAWQAGTDAAFDKLYHKDGAAQFQIDTAVSYWSQQRKYLPEAKLTITAFYNRAAVETKAAAEKGVTGIFTNLLDGWDKPSVMNGNTYVPNLPLVGVVEISINAEKSGGTLKFKGVGAAPDGNLRFVLQRPSAK